MKIKYAAGMEIKATREDSVKIENNLQDKGQIKAVHDTYESPL